MTRLGRPKLIWSSIWLLLLKITKNAFINTSTPKGGVGRISILYWMQGET